MRRLRRRGAADWRRGGQDGGRVPRGQLERQAEPLQSFGLDGDGSVAQFLGTGRRLLQRLHHQRLSAHRRFHGCRADGIPVGLGGRAGRQEQSARRRGGRGSRGEGPGTVKQELGERDGGGGGGGRGRLGFEVGGLRVRGDFDVGGRLL